MMPADALQSRLAHACGFQHGAKNTNPRPNTWKKAQRPAYEAGYAMGRAARTAAKEEAARRWPGEEDGR